LEETLTISVADSELGFRGLLVGVLGWALLPGLSEALITEEELFSLT